MMCLRAGKRHRAAGLMCPDRSMPSRNSMAKNTEPDAVSPKSVMSTMCSWPILEAAFASCMKRATRSRFAGEVFRQHLERDALLDEHVLGEIDDAHAALAELAEDLVAIGDGGADVGVGRRRADGRLALRRGVVRQRRVGRRLGQRRGGRDRVLRGHAWGGDGVAEALGAARHAWLGRARKLGRWRILFLGVVVRHLSAAPG